MFAVVLADIGLFALLAGALAIVAPRRIPGIRTRPRALAVLAAGALLTSTALLLPARDIVVAHPVTALDRVLPTYQFHEAHSITVRASPERVYRAIKEVAPGEIRFFQTLIWLRRFGRPLPEGILNAPAGHPLLDVATATTFATLADDGREVLVGTVVIAPPGAPLRQPPTPEEILAVRTRDGFAVAAMNFTIAPAGDGVCVVSTGTRVYATDASARRRFAAYWRLIYPGSALIRRMWLRAIRARAER